MATGETLKRSPVSRLKQIFPSNYLRNVLRALKLMVGDRATLLYFIILLVVLTLGVIGPSIAPYEYNEATYTDGDINRLESPSLDHPLGTTSLGYDVLSRLLYGARPTVITGLLGGTLIITLGLSVGLVAGYVGGRVESFLMRLTDFAYGVPLIPFAIVMAGLLGVGFLESIAIIGLILWRGSARVIRSQILQIKERPFILAARSTGASRLRILRVHILPNVASMAILFFAMGIGYSIIIQAGLAFVGVSDPFVPSWGVMVRNAYKSAAIGSWWWSVPPSLAISFTVTATFMFGRSYERLVGKTEDSFLEMG